MIFWIMEKELPGYFAAFEDIVPESAIDCWVHCNRYGISGLQN